MTETTVPKLRNGWKLTFEQKEELKSLYVEGYTYQKLADKYCVTRSCIWGILNRHKSIIGKKILSFEDIEYAKIICENFSGTQQTPNRIICQSHIRKSATIDDHAFAEITPESAYYIGLLMSDGNVWNNQITLSFSGEDKEHVFNFKDFLKSTHKITIVPEGIMKEGYIKREQFHFQFVSNQIASDLAVFGVVPQKSLTAKINILENHPDFWRGMIDGDGSIHVGKKDNEIGLSLAGSEKIIEQFGQFIKKLYPKAKFGIKISGKNRRTFVVTMAGRTAAIVLMCIYKDNAISLARKKRLSNIAINNFFKHNQFV